MSTSTSVVDVPLVYFVIIIFIGAVEGIAVGFTTLAALPAALPEAAEVEAVAAGAANTTPVVTLYATSRYYGRTFTSTFTSSILRISALRYSYSLRNPRRRVSRVTR